MELTLTAQKLKLDLFSYAFLIDLNELWQSRFASIIAIGYEEAGPLDQVNLLKLAQLDHFVLVAVCLRLTHPLLVLLPPGFKTLPLKLLSNTT